jgi:uncharacterized protein YegP (UPF0339 family)
VSDADGELSRAAFEVYEDDGGEWRWRLRTLNGHIIADSAEGYSSQAAAVNGLDTVRAVARGARIDVERPDGEAVPDGGQPLESCDLCEEDAIAREDVENDETGEMATTELCEKHLNKLRQYNAGEEVDW